MKEFDKITRLPEDINLLIGNYLFGKSKKKILKKKSKILKKKSKILKKKSKILKKKSKKKIL